MRALKWHMTLLRELQGDALDPKVDITTVLRKARVLAARLNNPEFVAWIQHELNSYPEGAELPKYRILNVDARAHLIMGYSHMPRAGVMASQIPEQYRHWATTSNLSSSVAELSALIAGATGNGDGLQCPWPQELAVKFGASGYGGGRLRVQCISAWQEISVAAVVGIIETIRNRLLEFVLQIEAEAPGAGEAEPGQAPLPQEKVTQIFHTYISGGVAHIGGKESHGGANVVQAGSIQNSQVQQAGEHAAQTLSFAPGSQERSDLEQLFALMADNLVNLKLDEKTRKRAEAQLATMRAQLEDDEPDTGIIAQAGSTLRNVTEGAIGSLIAAAVQPEVWHLVSHTLTTLFPK
jgi:AbiTii